MLVPPLHGVEAFDKSFLTLAFEHRYCHSPASQLQLQPQLIDRVRLVLPDDIIRLLGLSAHLTRTDHGEKSIDHKTGIDMV
jgi:hypothetical protein